MKKLITLILLSFSILSYADENKIESLVSVESQHSAKQTADKLASIIEGKGITLFARIDHQKNAASVKLALRETEVIIFGNPVIGTPLMQCNQLFAIDLPQKILIWEDADKKVWLTYNNPEFLKQRYQLEGCDKIITKVSEVLHALASAAAK